MEEITERKVDYMYISKELFDECWCPCEGIGNGTVITFDNAEELMLALAKELCE